MLVLRTVSICLVGVSAYFALSVSARRGEEPDTNSRSPTTSISPTKAKNLTIAPEKTTLYFDKNNESRTLSGERVIAQISKELPDTSLTLGLKTGTTSTVEELQYVEIEKMTKDVAHLLADVRWRKLIETADIIWEINVIRERILSHCLHVRESPAYTFRIMKVHLFTADTQRYDRRLLWWFDYVKKYRRLGSVSTIETAKSDTATSHGVFDDKELFAFLVNEFDLQSKKDTSSALLSSKMMPLDSRQEVVALFEWLRHKSDMKELAEGMQFHMASMSNTEHLVFHEWLQARVSPVSIFGILRVGSHSDVGMLTWWLKYVEAYWSNMMSAHNEQYFYYDVFLRFLAEKLSWNGVTRLLNSELFHQVFDKAPQYGFGTHAKNLQALWTRWLWFENGESPRDYFRYICPSGKFEPGDLMFLQGILYVNLFRAEKHFTNRDLLGMLSEQHTFEEIVGLFQWLQKYPGMQEIANDMLKYLANPRSG